MAKTSKFTQTLLASALAVVAGSASAAAFQLAEVSTSGLGRAYAGEAAITDNAAVVATNPALMSLLKQPEISVGAIYVDPNINLTSPMPGFAYKNIAPNALVPTVYGVYPINEKFAVGGGLNVNYGLATEFDDKYAGGFLGGKTDLTAINFNLSGAYRVTEKFSVGLGLNAVHAKAKLERYAGVALKLKVPNVAQLAALPANTVISKLQGDKWGFGWNAGLVYEFNERNRIGIAYHSQVDINFKGQYSNHFPLAAAALLQTKGITATGGKEIPGTLHLPLPAYWEISGYHKMTDRFAMHYSYKYTQWSKFKELRAKGTDGKTLFSKTEEFRDSSRIALGASYDVTDALTVRTGIAYDESAADEHNTISIPDTDRTWFSVGATYRFTPNVSIDAGFAHLKGKKNTFKEEGVPFTSKASANLYGLNVNYRF
ncbi:outer membrane protein transport protein [Pasteurella multocida]|uniref:outer membrane protein transport protein n=1 Tax=Pasteurella multocida TaxID=747 RepID=UPI0022557895|nr:outer membrane protein transport protein [Pasteurella multocida]UZT13865.1 outer membrane protein transport protein [Pasteurella multocida]UZT16428.1 outer membrane protein transport protein [Pasteurella multocida]UZU32481.1 outer membrane protein transport protein [Pasteurella multocida]UZU37138.1 outer membrane protein transport protein [Pasteurella multocida]UZU43957.1 outer membrane protein transport protein [Pasteurella multocida]